MRDAANSSPTDWVGNLRTYTLARGVPSLIIIISSLFAAPLRAAIWSMVLGKQLFDFSWRI
jgi:hypothetical protein